MAVKEIGDNLFNFDKLNDARENFKNDLAAKRAFCQARAENMVAFDTLFTRKSCLDVLHMAKEFLADEEMRVKKTPAGFNRPRSYKKRP